MRAKKESETKEALAEIEKNIDILKGPEKEKILGKIEPVKVTAKPKVQVELEQMEI